MPRTSISEIFLIFLRLGLTSFGGPVAHLGYFRRECVERRAWLDEHRYAELVALCQFLPGPASSQVGMALGLSQGGIFGALAAWAGFTLPSAVFLTLFGLSYGAFTHGGLLGWLHGVHLVATAVVAQALAGMGRSLCPDAPRMIMAVTAAATSLYLPATLGQLTVIALGALAGVLFLKNAEVPARTHLPSSVSRTCGAVMLGMCCALGLILPLISVLTKNPLAQLADAFYRAGALVFGGGHVVLPLLQAAAPTVPNDAFLAGYGAAQAVPGPLFTFAAYLGCISGEAPSCWLGAWIALIAIFLPSFLLIVGVTPFWERWRNIETVRTGIAGVNAGVVGLLAAALYDPLWKSAIHTPTDFILLAGLWAALTFGGVSPVVIVMIGAATGSFL